ncbi:histidine phosphatase family protein [Lactobacillus sp. PFC-70]|nr:histidine phosphatase family protein [Lactobacillus sp. PFC-70]
MKTLTIDFVRHGQTLFNILNKLQGWADSPLTEAGIAMADATGQRLQAVHYDRYYSSDLKRAIDTAQHIINANQGHHEAPTTSPLFREVYFGSYEGSDNDQVWGAIARPLGCTDQADIIRQHSFTTARDAMHRADPHHFAEDGATFYHRIDQALTQLLTDNAAGDHLLVVSHGTFIRTLTLRFGPQFHPENDYPANGSVTTLRLTAQEAAPGFTAEVLAYNQQ